MASPLPIEAEFLRRKIRRLRNLFTDLKQKGWEESSWPAKIALTRPYFFKNFVAGWDKLLVGEDHVWEEVYAATLKVRGQAGE